MLLIKLIFKIILAILEKKAKIDFSKLIFSIKKFYQKKIIKTDIKQKMGFIQVLIALALMIFDSQGNINKLEFTMRHTINPGGWSFSVPSVYRVFMNQFYINDVNGYIYKMNIATGAHQGTFAQSSTPQVNDFMLHGNGTLLIASYNNSETIAWDTSSFSQITSATSPQPYLNINYLDLTNQLLATIRQNQSLTIRNQNISLLYNTYRRPGNFDHKFFLSKTKDSYVNVNSNFQFELGSFSYNNTQLNINKYIGGVLNGTSYFGNNAFAAQNVPFTFYLIEATKISQIACNAGTFAITVQYALSATIGQIVSFKQMALANQRMAFVPQTSRKEIIFLGQNSFFGNKTLTIPENIVGLETSNDKRTLILILESQIKIYEISCVNNTFYDPNTFDCLNCAPECLICNGTNGDCTVCLDGYFLANYFCNACDASCESCENSTGCVSCVSDMQPIAIGLLCQPNHSTNNTTTTNPSTVNTTENFTNNSSLQYFKIDIPQELITFLSIPAALRIPLQSPILLAISDFWIYNFHNNTYGPKVRQVFELIHTIEQKKWAFAQFDTYLNITLSPLQIGFSNYSNYSNPKFLQIQSTSSTFIESLLEFFVYLFPVVVILFLLYRFIFFKTYKYRISRHFRKYSLNAFLIFFLIQGNYEYMCYCCFNQSQLLFFFNFIDKINAWLWSTFFFFCVMYGFGAFYMTYWFYPKLSKKFIQETYRILPSFAVYTIITNGKNIALAAIQSFFFSFYRIQIYSMLGVHSIVVGALLFCEIKYGIFKRSLFFHLLILQTAIKVALNLLFLIQHSVEQKDSEQFDMLEDCLIAALYIWACLIIFQIVGSFFPQNIEVNDKLPSQSQQQKQSQKSNEQTNNCTREGQFKSIRLDTFAKKAQTNKGLGTHHLQNILVLEQIDEYGQTSQLRSRQAKIGSQLDISKKDVCERKRSNHNNYPNIQNFNKDIHNKKEAQNENDKPLQIFFYPIQQDQQLHEIDQDQ